MIILEKDKLNTIIYTASEGLDAYQAQPSYDYNLLLENCQTLATVSIPIEDISTNSSRYNQSKITLMTLSNSTWSISISTLIMTGQVKIWYGNIVIDGRTGGKLTNNGTLIVMDGTITGDFVNNGIYLNIDYSQGLYVGNDVFLINMDAGFYDYKIYDANYNSILEVGNILIGPYTASTPTQYTPTKTNKVYNG